MSDTGVQIVVICTANVCRSPAAEARLKSAFAALGLADLVRVTSAGTDADPGAARCPHAPAPAAPTDTPPAPAHAARLLTADDLRHADLVLALDRAHRSACARLLPACRPRLFTLWQAALLARALGDQLAGDALPDGSPPLPPAPADRLRWAFAELDAARGLLAATPDAALDVTDRHGPDPHPQVFTEIDAAVDVLVTGLAAVLTRPGV